MRTSKTLVPAAVSVAVVAGLGASPVVAATATSISATTAGTKAVGHATFVWGNVAGVPKGTQVCDQVLLPTGSWSRSQCSTTQTDAGYYAIPLTYGASTPGRYIYRVVSSGNASQQVTLTRVAGTKTGYVMADPNVQGSYVNIRAAASTTSAIVGKYGPHAKVVGTPVGDGIWWKVPAGYVQSATLTTATSNPSTINARIPLNQLCLIPREYYSHNGTKIGYGYTETTPRYLQCKALPSLNQLEAAYKVKFGKYAEIDNGYRDWAEQSYWYNLYKPLGVTVSAPGTSNHGYGLSIDFRANYRDGFNDFQKGGPGYNWLIANQTKYGFNNPYDGTKVKDDVHWNFVG